MLNDYNTAAYASPSSYSVGIAVQFARIKDGFVGQVLLGTTIVWETKHAYDTQDEALTKANKHVRKALKGLLA